MLAAVVAAWLGLPSTVAFARDLYVSPQGTANGSGSKDRPLDLSSALNNAVLVKAGDTIWVSAGKYIGDFVQAAAAPQGTAQSPIIYRSVPGARATIEGTIRIKSNHIWLWGLEVTSAGETPQERIDAVHLGGGDGIRLINLVVHDNPNASGIGGWDVGNDHEYYGCLLYRNGRNGRGFAHGIYTQNTARHTTKKVSDSLIFNNFGWGVHCYGQGPELANYLFEGVTSFGNGLPAEDPQAVANFLVGGYQNADNIIIRDCATYFPATGNFKRGADFGYIAPNNGNLTVERSLFIGGLEAVWLKHWQKMTFRENTCYTPGGNALAVLTDGVTGFDPQQSRFEGNTYYRGKAAPLQKDGAGFNTIEAWREATGWDRNSHLLDGPPKEPVLRFRPNKYEPDRAYLTVYNWPKTEAVQVDLGRLWGLEKGHRYSVTNVEDIWSAPVTAGVYDGRPLSLKMTGTYAPEFACYLVTKQ